MLFEARCVLVRFLLKLVMVFELETAAYHSPEMNQKNKTDADMVGCVLFIDKVLMSQKICRHSNIS